MSLNGDVSAGDKRPSEDVQERKKKLKIDAIRLQTAQTIKEARVMADDNQLEEAKDIIVKAQSFLNDFNLLDDKVDELNKLIDPLKSDLQWLLKLMKTQETYQKQGRRFALSRETSHDQHHLAAKGPSSGTGRTKVKIITKREAPLKESNFNVILELTSNEKPGLDLVTVLDVSGSMQGEKLETVKIAMQLVIKKLSPIDRLSVVTFSSHSNMLCPLRHMTENSKAEIEKLVRDLVASGGTNISAGLERGLQVLKDDYDLTSRRWVAIMLLCDGEPGPRDPNPIMVKIDNYVPVYTFGLGSYYNPEVLKTIATNSSGGIFTDVRNVDELTEKFSQCLDVLLGLVVKDLKVTITQENDAKIEKVSAENYSQYRNNNGSVTVSLDDVYEKELRKVIVDLLLPASSGTKCVKVLNISYTYSFRGKQINTKPLFVKIIRRNSTRMINEARIVKDKQLNVANKMIIEAQKLLKNVVDETLKSEVQQLNRLMNSQKTYNQQESEEVTFDDSRLRTARTTSLAPIGHSNNEVENHPIEFLLDRTEIRQTIPRSLKWSEYGHWSENVKTYLKTLKVWKVIEPEEPPIETTESVESDGENSLATRKAIEDLRKFRENWMALIVINEACGIPIKLQIIDLDCARTAWETLATNSKQGGDVEKLFEAVQHCDWKEVERLLDFDRQLAPKLARVSIPSSNNTVLHLASLAGEVNIVKKLAGSMEREDLEIGGNDGYTALANASINGDTRIAKYMVEKNRNLVSIPTTSKLLPVVIAAMNGHKQMTSYLYYVTPPKDLTNEDNNKGNINGATLLTYSIRMQLYDISFDLIKKNDSLTFALDHYGQSALYQFACTPSAFPSGSQLKFWQRLMYICVPVHDIDCDTNDMRLNVPQEDVSQSNRRNVWYRGIWQQIASRLLAVLGIKRIYEMKLVHHQSPRLLHRICQDLSNLNEDEVVNGIINALHEAAEKGVVELITHILEKLPELRQFRDQQGSTIFMKAVEFRQERVFSLLQEFASKDKMIDWVDDSGENVLHKLKYKSVDKISSIQGAVLKMQKELQWLEEIKPMMSRDSLEKQNSKGNATPLQLFSESHEELMKNAEKWMYKTANSCIIVGVLVVTIMFAAAFTVPGGNDQNTGSPLFLRKKMFKVFIVSDAVSLFSSTTSVLIFLGILSSRYAERDFLKSLPRKMIFGLFTLFLSIATMKIAFAATLFMMFHSESSIILPALLSSLAFFPLMLYVGFLFPLLLEFTMSTYGPSIFHRKSKWWFFSFFLNRKVKWLLIG